MSVKIVKNGKSELVFTPNSKPSTDGKERGFYVVESTNITMEGGFINENKVTALLTVEKSLAEKLNWKEGHTLPGKIIVMESFTPFYEGQDAKINPSTKDAVKVDGKLVYRQAQYTEDSSLCSSLLRASQQETISAIGASISGALNK